MGIINVTPDSFSDGGMCSNCDSAVEFALKLVEQGADIIDIGGESTRPGADEVTFEEEYQRVIPVIRELRKSSKVTISVDTRKANIAEAAIEAGANIVNDISSLRHDADMIDVLKSNPDISIVLMHMLGNPSNMQDNPYYENVVSDVYAFFEERIEYCVSNGIDIDRLIIDPGIGFGKSIEHNLELLANLKIFQQLKLPILLGTSRKSFVNMISKSNPEDRLAGSLASIFCFDDFVADIIRVHDVFAHKQFIDVKNSIWSRKQS
jgi:dihydropteroate synthase